jgi:hypothetical protein
MARLIADNYHPPFVTETDEARWDDCLVCSVVMAVACATTGESVMTKDWRPMTKAQLKVLRERLRNYLPESKQSGPTTLADARYYMKEEYPWLPEIPFYDSVSEYRTFSDMLRDLRNGWVAVGLGNPSQINNTSSALRRWTNSDDFGHAVLFERASDSHIFVMDPLGSGEYDGQWVPIAEVSQYLWRFKGNDGQTYVKASLFKKGAWSEAALDTENLRDTLSRVRLQVTDLGADLSRTEANLREAREARKAAEASATACSTLLDAARLEATTLRETNSSLVTQLAQQAAESLVAQDALNAQIAALGDTVATLVEEREALQQRIADLDAQIDEFIAKTEEIALMPVPDGRRAAFWKQRYEELRGIFAE